MNNLVKYTFYPDSVEGLKDYIELYAHNYKEAKHKVLKFIFLGQTKKHPPRGEKQSEWEIIL